MANHKVNIQIHNIPGGKVEDYKGKAKRITFIVPNDSVWISDDGEKQVLSLMAWEKKESQWQETHSLKLSRSKEESQKLKELPAEERYKKDPFIGYLKPPGRNSEGEQGFSTPAPATPSFDEDEDDLPF